MENLNKNEGLFWSVFRNKFLNRLIFKGSDFKFSVYTYYEMNNVEWMLYNNHFSLLKEKILRKDRNLNFFIKNPFQLELNSQPIFKYYKDDTELFSNLFKNYRDNKYLSQLTLADLEKLSIKHDNVALLKVLIDELGYCLDKNEMIMFYDCIGSGSFEIATFLYNNYIKDSMDEMDTELKNKIWIDTIGYRSDPNYNEKVQFYYSIISKTIPPFSKAQSTTDRVEINKFSNPVLFSLLIYSSQLKFIIKCCKTISLLLLSTNCQQLEFSYSKKDIIEMEELKKYEIPDLIFTKNELYSKMQSFSFKNTIIQRLYKMVLLFSNSMDSSSTSPNIAFYQIKYNGKINNRIYTTIFKPQSFGYYISGFKDYSTNSLDDYLFEYCRNDRIDRIIPFFKDAIQEILNPSIDQSLKPSKNLLINYAIILNDFEIMEMVYNQLFLGSEDNNIILLDEVYYMNDVKLFDFYIYKLSEQHRLHILNRIGENFLLSTHFKNNYPVHYRNALIYYQHPFQNQLYISRFLAENYKDIPSKSFDVTKKYPLIIHRSIFIDFKLPPTKLTHLNQDGIEVELKIPQYKLHQDGYLSSVVHQLNWVLQYRSQDIKDGTLIISHDFILLTQYLRNNIEETILNDINDSFYHQQKHSNPKILNYLLEEISKRGDIKTIQFLIDQFKNNQPFSDHIINYSKSFSLGIPINQIDFYNYLNNKN
ncbi:hypothetical protein ACTFIU_007262 [Dictyostelium citrinum]